MNRIVWLVALLSALLIVSSASARKIKSVEISALHPQEESFAGIDFTAFIGDTTYDKNDSESFHCLITENKQLRKITSLILPLKPLRKNDIEHVDARIVLTISYTTGAPRYLVFECLDALDGVRTPRCYSTRACLGRPKKLYDYITSLWPEYRFEPYDWQ